MFTVVKIKSEHISHADREASPLRHSCWYTLMSEDSEKIARKRSERVGQKLKACDISLLFFIFIIFIYHLNIMGTSKFSFHQHFSC